MIEIILVRICYENQQTLQLRVSVSLSSNLCSELFVKLYWHVYVLGRDMNDNPLIIHVISNSFLAGLWFCPYVGSLILKVFLTLTSYYLWRGK